MLNHFPKDNNAILEIDLKGLTSNYNTLNKKLSDGTECAITIKANAYGIGDKSVLSKLIKSGCKTYFVAHLSEAVRLRSYSKKIKIFSYHGINKDNLKYFKNYDIIPVINNLEQLRLVNKFNLKNKIYKGVAIHFDTGMSRLGLDEEETDWLIKNIKKFNHIKLELIMSHLACADKPKHPMNLRQLKKFTAISNSFKNIKASLANSAGIFLGKKYHFDMVRPGIAIYGGNPLLSKKVDLRNVVSLKVKIIQIRKIKKNDTVGYGASYRAKKEMVIGTIPIGYADGFNRKYTNNLSVRLNNKPINVIGRISMDLITIDLTKFLNLAKSKKDTYVDVFNKTYDINQVSNNVGTIPYEILTSLGNRYKIKYL